MSFKALFMPFLANVPVLYPLKTPENLWFPGIFREYRPGPLAGNELNLIRLGFFLETHLCLPIARKQSKTLFKFKTNNNKKKKIKNPKFLSKYVAPGHLLMVKIHLNKEMKNRSARVNVINVFRK